MNRYLRIALLLPTLILTGSTASASDDSPEQFVKQLLATYWEKGLENNRASSTSFSAAQKIYRDHESVLLAYAVNRMQHRSNKDALKIARTLNREHEDNLDGWMLRVWLEALTDNYNQSLVAMIQLKRQISKQPMDVPTATRIYSRLGRVIGYMQGPVNDKVTPDTLDAAMRTVVQGMNPDQLDLFNVEREKVLTQYESLSKTYAKKIGDQREQIRKQNEVEADNLQKRNVDLQQQVSQIMPQIDQVRGEGDRQVEAIRSQTSPLESEMASLQSDIRSLRLDLQLMYDDLFRLQARYPRHPDIPFLANRIRNAEFTLADLSARGRNLSVQVAQLHVRMRQVKAEFDSRIARLNNEVDGLQRERRKNNKRLDRLARGPQVAPGKVEALDDRVKALTTYDPFPLELYRMQLADLLIK